MACVHHFASCHCAQLRARWDVFDPTPWPCPTAEMMADPRFNRIWEVIKHWDINVPSVYNGYTGATGCHARAIFEGLGFVGLR